MHIIPFILSETLAPSFYRLSAAGQRKIKFLTQWVAELECESILYFMIPELSPEQLPILI